MSVAAGTGISVATAGGTATVTNAAPATADQVYQAPNSASNPVTIGEWKTGFTSNTAGAEYTYYHAIVQNNGSPVTFPIEQSNLSGMSAVTTPAGSTPSVALPPTTDVLKITVDHNITSLTITGLNDAVDACYESVGHVANGHAQVFLEPNGVPGAAAVGFYITNSTLGLLGSAATGMMWMDSDTAGVAGTSTATVCGSALGRSFYVTMITQNGGAGFTEWYNTFDATSAGTTPMTSVTLAGALNARTVIFWRRLRPTRN